MLNLTFKVGGSAGKGLLNLLGRHIVLWPPSCPADYLLSIAVYAAGGTYSVGNTTSPFSLLNPCHKDPLFVISEFVQGCPAFKLRAALLPLAVDLADAASRICFDLCWRTTLQELDHIAVFYVGFFAIVRCGKKAAFDPSADGWFTDTVSLGPQALMDLPDASSFVEHDYPPFLTG